MARKGTKCLVCHLLFHLDPSLTRRNSARKGTRYIDKNSKSEEKNFMSPSASRASLIKGHSDEIWI